MSAGPATIALLAVAVLGSFLLQTLAPGSNATAVLLTYWCIALFLIGAPTVLRRPRWSRSASLAAYALFWLLAIALVWVLHFAAQWP
jgi:hypothetical protein